ncbi:MAG: FAD-binding protein [Acidimicrobiales bacterium]
MTGLLDPRPATALDSVPTTRQVLSGWGGTAPSAADVIRPRTGEEVDAVMEAVVDGDRAVLARGLGRCYGDAAQCAGGVVVDATGLDAVLAADLEAGWVRVGAGMSLDTLMRLLLPRGWFVPVSPGTRFVTVGGAIAADIHGKNHHADGSFCTHVTRLSLATPTGRHEVGPEDDPELFWATAGGMGLTGIVVDATVRLLPVETSLMVVDTERFADVDGVMAAMVEGDHRYRYSVAWVDSLARGRHLGRAVLGRGDHARRHDLPADTGDDDARAFDPGGRLPVPFRPPSGLLNPLTVGLFNEAWYRKAPRRRLGQLQALPSFFHPLDGVEGWNRIYGPRGFLQYQCVVPDAAAGTIGAILERTASFRAASFVTVLKRFGPGDPGPLSFPMAGWTLTLDLATGDPRLGPFLDGLDTLVAEAGGRLYLAKDSRLRPELLEAMYRGLPRWRAARRRVDPDGRLVSDLARRLGLVGAAGRREPGSDDERGDPKP